MTSYGPMRVPGAITEERSISFMTTEQEHRRRRSGNDGGWGGLGGASWQVVGRVIPSVFGSGRKTLAQCFRRLPARFIEFKAEQRG